MRPSRSGIGTWVESMAPVTGSRRPVSRVAATVVMRHPSNSGWAAETDTSMAPTPCGLADHTA